MKLTTQLKKKLVFLALVATFTNCSKDDIIKPQTELPPITQTGENTVGCLVDGKVVLPYQKKPFGVPSATCYYQFLDGAYEFGLSFFNNKQNPSSNIFIGGNKLEFIEGQTYQLKDEKNKNSAYAYVSIEGGGIYNYSTTDTITGELTITKLDPTKSIISGTFWFDAERITDGKIIKIREGRFDMQYTV